MNKPLTLMIGLGAMLIYLSKKKSATRVAGDEGTCGQADAEKRIDASSPGACQPAGQITNETTNGWPASHRDVDRAGLLTPRNKLEITRSSILDRCLSGCRRAGEICGIISGLPVARSVLPVIVRGGRLVYRLIKRISFRICL